MSRLLIAIGCTAVVLTAVTGSTLSAFSSQTSSSNNTFDAATTFGSGMEYADAAYSGNNADPRAFTGLGFQPDVVIVKGNNTQTAAMRTSTMVGDLSKPLAGATALTANIIQSLDADGFTLGNNARVNATGTNYWWMAFKAAAGELKVGNYTGNGQPTQSFTGFGFSPEYVAVLPAAGTRATQRFSGMTRGFQFDNDVGTTTRITSLNADGFTVGNSNEVNQNNQNYHYVAWNDTAGSIDVGTYPGTGVAKNVLGVGFQPQFTMVRANDTATARNGTFRPASMSGNNSLMFAALVNITNGLTAFQTDGFTVGTNVAVNANGVTYHYLSAKD